MNDNLEELVREGINRLTAESEIPDGLVGRARRRVAWRRRSLRGAVAVGAAATATVAAIAVTSLLSASHQLLPASHQPSHSAHARLAAWTVTKLADGNISVTINQFKDPAGLQSTLRADGVPASVTFVNQLNPACKPYPGGTTGPQSGPVTPLLKQVFPQPYQRLARLTKAPKWAVPAPASLAPHPPAANSVVIVIDRSALPSNSGVQLASNYAAPRPMAILLPQVVYASVQCTGS